MFAMPAAGSAFAGSAWEKWHDPTWTGYQSSAAISGFIKGADQKAVTNGKNAHPDVLPPTHTLNDTFFSRHARPFAWLVFLGESCVPIGALVLYCVRFPGSRGIALVVAGLAALLNLVYMFEGSSELNPPMLVLWLTVVWLPATLPAAARVYAIDLGRAADGSPAARRRVVVATRGESASSTVMLPVALACCGMIHPGVAFAIVLLASVFLAVVLFAFGARLRPMDAIPGRCGTPRPRASACVCARPVRVNCDATCKPFMRAAAKRVRRL